MVPPLIGALLSPACYTHPVTHVDLMETHISWVLLTGQHAYKIKKPLNLGFLDFSTLDARLRCCEEEMRLNRRLAPAIYEAVVKITGSPTAPSMDGDGDAIEYAVMMRQFPQGALASRLLVDRALTGAHIDALAARIAAFHHRTGVAARGSAYGSPENVIASARDNVTALEKLLPDAADLTQLAELRAWTEKEYQARWTRIEARQTAGFVRECHGDLHLGNIVMLDGELTPFDCIEFNPALRWIDVMSEAAFVVMDLMDRGRTDYANRFLNAYLEAGGDYDGIDLLRFYLVYRAMVRAKVHALRALQAGIDPAEHARLLGESRDYLGLARECMRAACNARPPLILMHGLSGCGKSVVAQALAEYSGAIRLRSDVERKRLAGLASLARGGAELDQGIYNARLTLATYQKLLDLARQVTTAGYSAVVDATFLKAWQRELFHSLAQTQKLPLVIIDVSAPEAVLRERIAARAAAGNDASDANQAVLTQQMAHSEALTEAESAATIRADTSRGDAQATLLAVCEGLRKHVTA